MMISELVRRYGSPLYLYELDTLVYSCADLKRFLPAPSTLYYSLKANPHPLLVGSLRKAGCLAEISSQGELRAAQEAGFEGAECLYTGPGKTRVEIEAALRAGVFRFSVESVVDYRRVANEAFGLGVTAECILRVNSSQARGMSGMRMSGASSQFGHDIDSLLRSPESFATLPGGRLIGVHFFALSNARSEEDLIDSLSSAVIETARIQRDTDIPIRMVDLGGGFASPYAEPGTPPNYQSLRGELESVLDTYLPGWRQGNPEIAFESGRYLVCGSGHLVSTVTDVKRSRDRTYVVLDSGINHLGGLAGLGRLLPVNAAVVPVSGKSDESQGAAPSTLVGPLCSPADVLAHNCSLGLVTPGSLVTVPNVGAYGPTASLLGFLSRPVAGELVLNEGVLIDASRIHLTRSKITLTGTET